MQKPLPRESHPAVYGTKTIAGCARGNFESCELDFIGAGIFDRSE